MRSNTPRRLDDDRPSTRPSPARRNAIIGGALAALLLVAGLIAVSIYQGRQPEFTIARGESLVTHVGYQRAIKVAEKFSLPVYMGRERTPITYDEARGLESQTDRVRVVVPVYAGDHFNLKGRWSFTPSSHRTTSG